MIKVLRIENFKSVKNLQINCGKINVFIGEPNTGKSNILEALGLLSWCASSGVSLTEFIRFQLLQNLFYDSLMDEPIRIEYQGEPNGIVTVKFEQDRFVFGSNRQAQIARLDYNGRSSVSIRLPGGEAFKFYRFKPLDKFDSSDPSSLLPPNGSNLFSVVYGSKILREQMVDLFRPYGLSVVMKPHEKTFEVQKQVDGVVTSHPYSMISDTFQRVVFYSAAMVSNRNSVLVFEEPEAHAFPYYTKHLGETIAFDETNQYFIATHNPYLLGAIVEKAPKDQVSVFATFYRNYQTGVRALTGDDLSRLLDADPFLSLDLLLGEDAK